MAIIGIIGSVYLTYSEVPFHENQVFYTRKKFVDAIQELGHTPLIIPLDKPENASKYVNIVDKIFLTGGEDVNPDLYGEEPHHLLANINPARDDFELAIIDEALKANKAIFGLCRGLQLLNVYFGGNLYQDLSLANTELKHFQVPTSQDTPTHKIQITSESPIKFLGDEHKVNSYHHQAIKKLANNFTIVAESSDKIIEAISDLDKRILAVQWHPEHLWEKSEKDKELFSYFLNKL